MESYETNLLEQAIELIQRAIAHSEAVKNYFPILQFVPQENAIRSGCTSQENDFESENQKENTLKPLSIKKIFIKGKTASVRLRLTSENQYSYEIRYNHRPYSLSATSKNLETAKKMILEKLKQPIKQENKKDLRNFNTFTEYYFSEFRKNRVADGTLDKDISRYEKHIKIVFGCRFISTITPKECKDLIENLKNQEKFKTASEVYSLLNLIFKSAILHDIIQKNPMSLVPTVIYEQKHGDSLTDNEIDTLMNATVIDKIKVSFALALFCGLRPNEIPSAKIVGNFIVAENSKQKDRRIHFKKIPICNRLRQYLDLIEDFSEISTRTFQNSFKKILPNHRPYDLRLTFYSKCKEFGVAVPAYEEFMGHSLGKIGNAYTDLSEEYLLEEGKKLNKW